MSLRLSGVFAAKQPNWGVQAVSATGAFAQESIKAKLTKAAAPPRPQAIVAAAASQQASATVGQTVRGSLTSLMNRKRMLLAQQTSRASAVGALKGDSAAAVNGAESLQIHLVRNMKLPPGNRIADLAPLFRRFSVLSAKEQQVLHAYGMSLRTVAKSMGQLPQFAAMVLSVIPHLPKPIANLTFAHGVDAVGDLAAPQRSAVVLSPLVEHLPNVSGGGHRERLGRFFQSIKAAPAAEIKQLASVIRSVLPKLPTAEQVFLGSATSAS